MRLYSYILTPHRAHFFSLSMLSKMIEEVRTVLRRVEKRKPYNRAISPKGKHITAVMIPQGPYFVSTSWSPLAHLANTVHGKKLWINTFLTVESR